MLPEVLFRSLHPKTGMRCLSIIVLFVHRVTLKRSVALKTLSSKTFNLCNYLNMHATILGCILIYETFEGSSFMHLQTSPTRSSSSWYSTGSYLSAVLWCALLIIIPWKLTVDYFSLYVILAPFASLKKQAETLFRLICCERKTLFRLKNKLKNTDYKTNEHGHIILYILSFFAGTNEKPTSVYHQRIVAGDRWGRKMRFPSFGVASL